MPGNVESANALVAGASSQQILRSLQPLLPEVFTGPRVCSTEVQLCQYLMVAHRMSCVSKLVQATLPRQKPHYRGEVPSTVSYLSRIEPEKTCSMPDALAQTCWLKKEENGTLHVDESD